jgi:radical SAM-linked protein
MPQNQKLKYRLKFIKTGNVRFIGHLDLMSLFNMAIKRADIPIAYSEGFNPHQLLSFALPLSLGYHSNAEYLDLSLTEAYDCKELVTSLNNTMPDGIKITIAAHMPDSSKSAASIISACAYTVILPSEFKIPSSAAKDFIAQKEIVISKKTKKSLADVDIMPDILDFSTQSSGEFIEEIHMRISAGPERSIRADSVVKALFAFAEIEYPDHGLTYIREEMYKDIKGEKPLI